MDVLAVTNERYREEVHPEFGGKLDVFSVDLRERRRGQAAAFLIDALVV
jgi:hypothetical protein